MFWLRSKPNFVNYVLLLRVLEISTISSFRWLLVGLSIVVVIIVVQILDRSNLDKPGKLQQNTLIAAQDHQDQDKRIKLDIETIRAKKINVQAEEGRTNSANRSNGNRY